jgi:hypothetical protein
VAVAAEGEEERRVNLMLGEVRKIMGMGDVKKRSNREYQRALKCSIAQQRTVKKARASQREQQQRSADINKELEKITE